MSAAGLVDDSPTLRRDLIDLFVGEKIGSGVYRDVFEIANRPSAVVKIETGSRSFMNQLEWEVWREVQGTKWSGYFAPCLDISPCGTALIMARTQPLTKWPKNLEIPAFFEDVKLTNFGTLMGRIVCHDYSICHLVRANLRGVKMKPVQSL